MKFYTMFGEDYLAIKGDELNNDGSACVEVIPKYSLN
jgi:hypothetical protein